MTAQHHARIRPGLVPDERWRAALKRAIITEAHTNNGPSVRDDAGSRDNTDSPVDHIITVEDPYSAITVTACDLEPVTEADALRVGRLMAAMRDAKDRYSRGL